MGFLDWASVLSGPIQSGIQFMTSKYNTDKTIKANREMADLAYNRDVEMWERNNAYNSPEAQMARLQSAGLNPNMVYGSGSVSGNSSAPSMPKYQVPRSDYNYSPPVDVANVLASFQDMRLKQAQRDNIEAQTENIRSRTQNEQIRGGLLEVQKMAAKLGIDLGNIELQQKGFDLGKDQAMFPHQMDALQLQNEKATQELEIMSSQVLKMDAERAGILLENLRKSQQLEIGRRELSLYDQRDIAARLENKLRNLDIDIKQFDLKVRNPKDIEKLNIEIENAVASKLWKDQENEWRRHGVTSSDALPFRVLTRMYMISMGMLGVK